MLDTLKMILGIEDNSKDTLLSFVIEDCENLINSYCHTENVPTKLESIVPIMAADMYRRKGFGQADVPQSVKSITQGDRSISFENTSVGTDDFLKEYEARLKPFRRGRVPSDI